MEQRRSVQGEVVASCATFASCASELCELWKQIKQQISCKHSIFPIAKSTGSTVTSHGLFSELNQWSGSFHVFTAALHIKATNSKPISKRCSEPKHAQTPPIQPPKKENLCFPQNPATHRWRNFVAQTGQLLLRSASPRGRSLGLGIPDGLAEVHVIHSEPPGLGEGLQTACRRGEGEVARFSRLVEVGRGTG